MEFSKKPLIGEMTKVRLTGLWGKRMKTTGQEFWSSGELTEKELSVMEEFCSLGPVNFVIWASTKKLTSKHPDAYLWLYRTKPWGNSKKKEEEEIQGDGEPEY